MKSFKNFLSESDKGGLYKDSTSLSKFLELSDGEALHVFTVIEIKDPKISDFVTVLYDGYKDEFIVSEKIDFQKGKNDYLFKRKFLSFEIDTHNENAVSVAVEWPEEAMTIAQLLAAFEGDISYERTTWNLFELLTAYIKKNYPTSGFHPLKDFGEVPEFVNIVKGWEDDHEEKLDSSVLSRFGMSPGQVASRKYGL